MSDGTNIEWCDVTWPLVAGCRKRSPGCAHCWAIPMTWRLQHNPLTPQYHDAVEKVIRDAQGKRVQVRAGQPGTLQWTGAIVPLESYLEWPRTKKWKTGSKVFVSNMADLFDQDVPDSFLERAFRVMLEESQYTYQILTKEPGRLVDFAPRLSALVEEYGGSGTQWPAHLWFGVSIENPAMYWRILELIKVPAAIHFISGEPLLKLLANIPLEHIEWVIAGCESGPGARPMDEAWVEQLLQDTKRAEAAFFYKQKLNEYGHKVSLPLLQGRSWAEFPQPTTVSAAHVTLVQANGQTL
ncbi:hypothetical protein KDA_75870 [Dictyobacter alpinus]|uniref:DUF5131 family protein n=1 Tax=Dictyobacter alpinus TaxID=2014873 RepID=A0A402BL62_9CHLR|nr:DUF5131 family protein [Dictyobacter alpinus]GCE32103.1 hypothetical protein KDA_75870 [Dictyobacter alpinus]